MQYGYELYLQLPCKLGSDSNGRMGFQTTLPEGRLIQPSQHHCLQRLHVLISHHLLNSLFEISLGILLADVASFELIRR